MLRGWQTVAGPGLAAARLFSALWGTLAVAFTYAVARRLFSARVGLLAALCAGLSPYLVWYSQEARTYAPLLALTLCSTWLFLRALERDDGRTWAGYVVITGLCLYLHILAALLILAHVGMGAANMVKRRRARPAALLALAGVLLAGGPLWLLEARLFFAALPSGYAPAAPGQIVAGLLLAFTTGAAGRLPLFVAAPGLLLALAGALLPPAERGRSHALLWLLMPPAALILITLATPIFNERYLIFIAPAFYIFTARGALALARLWKPLGALALVALLLVNLAGLWVQYSQTIKPDFEGAAALYAAQRQDGDQIIFLIPQAQGVFEQVLPAGAGRFLAAPYANRPADQMRLDRRMRELVGAGGRVWLLESEAALWDRQGAIAGWLEAHGRRVLRAPLHLVTISLYEDVNTQMWNAQRERERFLPLVMRAVR
jgi:4-amino-4-deoxy-L-arabinose transferase-like glycosyltransferase